MGNNLLALSVTMETINSIQIDMIDEHFSLK